MTKEQKKIAKEIINQTNKYFDTNCQVKSRRANTVKPRMYACKIIKELTDASLQDIGDLFTDCWKGKKTHSNVIHAIKEVDRDLELIPKRRVYYIELRAIVETSSVYVNSTISKKSVISDIRQEVYNALMGKDIKELQQILNTIR